MPHSKTKQAPWDKTIDFWESGPVRQIVEMEFEIAMMEIMRSRKLPLSRAGEGDLHDVVVPALMAYIIDKVRWTDHEERNRAFTMENLASIRSELHRLLEREIGPDLQNGFGTEQPFLRPLMMPFKRWSGRLREFFHP